MKKFHIISLGCAKNLVDSERFCFLFENAGYKQVKEPYQADVILINTCGFIVSAKEESILTVLEALEYKQDNKRLQVFVTGCLVKRYLAELQDKIPEVDQYIELKDFSKLADLLGIQTPVNRRTLLTSKHFGYIRISDGCNNHCSYCAIPSIRGSLVSNPIEQVVEEATSLAAQGVKELIITAQDTAVYGMDLYGQPRIVELLAQLESIQGFEWIRLHYLHPAHIKEDLIEAIAKSKKLLPYFDIPLQHINSDLLYSMNRKINKEETLQMLSMIQKHIPHAVFRSTFIVGYPGEDKNKYLELKKFLHEAKLARVGIFTYSPEEDTPAATFESAVSKKTAERRRDQLMMQQQEISSEFLQSFIGKTISAIIDKKGTDSGIRYEGRAWFDSPDIDGILFITKGKATIGDIVQVRIIDSWEYDLVGEIINHE